MALNKPFNYRSGLWLLLSHVVLSQTCSKRRNNSNEDNHLEKFRQLQVFLHVLLPVHFESGGMTSHKYGLTAKRVAKWRPPKSLLSRQAGTSEAETLVSRKVESLLAIADAG